jgi:hypothetical protein
MPYTLMGIIGFILLVIWMSVLVSVVTDIFRSRDIRGLGKASWLAFVILLPFLGVFAYLIARGGDMTARERREPQEYGLMHGEADSRADALGKLADLHDHRLISDADYQRTKDKVLSGTAS